MAPKRRAGRDLPAVGEPSRRGEAAGRPAVDLREARMLT